jgi:signal transduction histidine kinase
MDLTRHTEKPKPRHPSLVLQASAILAFAAVAAGLWLVWLHRLQARVAHGEATRSVLAQGDRLMDLLADARTLANSTNLTAPEWRVFGAHVEGLRAAQNELTFVSIRHGGSTVFHREIPDRPAHRPIAEPSRTSVSTLDFPIGPGVATPMMVFTRSVTLPDGSEAIVEVGLNAAVIDATEASASRSIGKLLRFSAVAVAGAFGFCLLLLIAVVRHDLARQAKRRREEHLAFSGVLANGIVHDFRNPMSSVKLDAQMLGREAEREDGPRPERLAELTGRIGRTVERMDQVFKEFLYLARPDREAFETVALEACIRECVETLAPRLEAASVVMAFQPQPLSVRAAPFALRRALLNVLTNAVQFSPRGGTVDVTCAVQSSTVRIDIADRGPGVPPHERERIFEMFVSSRPEGSGLGLFLARTALRKCGGDIIALPRDGGGSIFRINLPSGTETAP